MTMSDFFDCANTKYNSGNTHLSSFEKASCTPRLYGSWQGRHISVRKPDEETKSPHPSYQTYRSVPNAMSMQQFNSRRSEVQRLNDHLRILNEDNNILQIQSLIPSIHRDRSEKTMRCILNGIDERTNDRKALIQKIYDTISPLEENQRTKILHIAGSIINDNDSVEARHSIFATLAQVGQRQLDDSFYLANRLTSKIFYGHNAANRTKLIGLLADIPSGERQEFCALVWPCIEKIQDVNHCHTILAQTFSALIPYSSADRKAILHIMTPLISLIAGTSTTLTNDYEKLLTSILELGNLVSTQDIQKIGKYTWRLITKIQPDNSLLALQTGKRQEQRIKVLKILMDMSNHDREVFCQNVWPHVRNLADTAQCSGLISALSLIPLNELDDAIHSVIPGLETISATLYPAMECIPLEKRATTFKHLFSLLGKGSHREHLDIYTLLASIPSEQRARVVEICALLGKYIPYGLNHLFAYLASLAPAQLLPVCKFSKQIIVKNEYRDGKDLVADLKLVSPLPKEQKLRLVSESPQLLELFPIHERAAIFKHLLPICTADYPSNNREMIYERLKAIPIENRSRYLTFAISMAEDMGMLNNGDCYLSFLYSLKAVPDHQLNDVYAYTKEFIPLFKDPQTIICILLTFNVLKNHERNEFAAQALDLITHGNLQGKNREYIHMLYTLENIPQIERTPIITLLKPLIRRLQSPNLVASLLELFHSRPAKQRPALLKRIQPYLAENKFRECNYDHLLKILSSAATADIDPLIKSALSVLDKFDDENERDRFINTLTTFPPQHREKMLNISLSFLNCIGADQRSVNNVLNFALTIPQEHLEMFLKMAKETIHLSIREYIVNTELDDLLKIICLIPQEEWQACIDRGRWQQCVDTVNAFMNFLDANRNKPIKFSADTLLSFIAPNKKLEIMRAVANNPAIHVKNIKSLLDYFFTNEKIRLESHQYLYEKFAAVITDREASKKLAAEILKYAQQLKLHDEHPLYQKALAAKYITDMDSSLPKNPYTLHQKLQKIRQEEQLLPYGPLGKILFTTAQGKFAAAVALDLAGMRKRAEKTSYTAADLPDDIPEDCLLKFFSSLENRLAALAKDKMKQHEKKLLEKAISEICQGSTLSDLKDQTIGFGKEIPRLLKLAGPKDQPIDTTVFYLYAILHAIMAKSSLHQSDEPLSPQELMFLKFLSQVQHCDVGQRDAIATYYNILSPAQNSQPKASVTAVKKVEQCVEQAMQAALHAAFASDEVLEEIAKGKVGQQSHQTLYLMNRLYLQAGLCHTPQFDLHTGVLDDSFVACTETIDLAKGTGLMAEKALQMVLAGIPPQKLLLLMKTTIATAIKNKVISHDNLTEYFEQTGISPASDIKSTDDWLILLHYGKDKDGEIDYTDFQGITDHAAFEILKNMGYLAVKDAAEIQAIVQKKLKSLIDSAIQTPREDGTTLTDSLGQTTGKKSHDNRALMDLQLQHCKKEDLKQSHINMAVRLITKGMTQGLRALGGFGLKGDQQQMPKDLQKKIDRLQALTALLKA